MTFSLKERFIEAKIYHKRFNPVLHHFNYKVYYLFFPLSTPETLKRCWLSIDRFNLLSFYHRDHGCQNYAKSSLEWFQDIYKSHHLNIDVNHIYLMTFPRVFGFYFNPLSLWFCFTKDQKLDVVLAEVNNTFGERHSYLLYHSDGQHIKTLEWLRVPKVFHVSPFFKCQGEYRFRFSVNDKKIKIWIHYYVENEKMLETSIHGIFKPLTNKILLKSFFRYFMMTLTVIMKIHFQAFKLWLKKVKFYKKPPPPQQKVSS